MVLIVNRVIIKDSLVQQFKFKIPQRPNYRPPKVRELHDHCLSIMMERAGSVDNS